MKKTNKIIVNKCYGRAHLTDWAAKYLKVDPWDFDREDSRIIHLVEEYKETCSAFNSTLVVITLPDDVTDWQIWDYDGVETVIYVQDGKMHTDFELEAE